MLVVTLVLTLLGEGACAEGLLLERSSSSGASDSSALGLSMVSDALSSVESDTRSGISSSSSLEMPLVDPLVGKSGWLRVW